MANEIKRKIVSEVTGAIVDSAFANLALSAGFPPLALASPFAKGLVLGLIENCYNDCSQRTLSVRESKKLNQVSSMALQTFREMAEKDGVVAWKMNMDPSYEDYAYEVAEHATLEAIRQSERTKVDILGRYFGNQLYKGNTDWQDMHQIITMAGALTLRQLVLVRLISEDFKDFDKKLYVSNPSACVEINRLKDYGIWQTEGAAFGINESSSIQLDSIMPTFYSDEVNMALMLDRISEEDVLRTVDSLHLVEEGFSQKELTEDEFKQSTTFKFDGEALILPGVKRFGKEMDDESF